MHGEDYVSLGFLFGERTKIAYISDVSRFPETTEFSKQEKHADIFYSFLNCLTSVFDGLNMPISSDFQKRGRPGGSSHLGLPLQGSFSLMIEI